MNIYKWEAPEERCVFQHVAQHKNSGRQMVRGMHTFSLWLLFLFFPERVSEYFILPMYTEFYLFIFYEKKMHAHEIDTCKNDISS